jgi:hypothetical protein
MMNQNWDINKQQPGQQTASNIINQQPLQGTQGQFINPNIGESQRIDLLDKGNDINNRFQTVGQSTGMEDQFGKMNLEKNIGGVGTMSQNLGYQGVSGYQGNISQQYDLGSQKQQIYPQQKERIDQEHLQGVQYFEQPMQEYFKMADNLEKIFSLILALELRIFDTLEEFHDFTLAKDLIQKLNFKTDQRHVFDLLDELYIHGYLERQGVLENARYKNTEYIQRYLLHKAPNNYAYVFHNLYKYIQRFSSLEKNFPLGKTHLFSEDLFADENDMRAFWDYYYKANQINFQNLLQNVDFSRFKRIMDLRGGLGWLSVLIKQKFLNAELISFDYKKVQSYVEEVMRGQHMLGWIRLEYGDILKDKLPEADCMIAPHILMHFNCDNKLKILKRIFESLPMNGELIIMENLMDEERSKDSHGLKISFMIGLMGYEGYSISFEEYRKLLQAAGFSDIQHINKGHGVADIILCRKIAQTGQ